MKFLSYNESLWNSIFNAHPLQILYVSHNCTVSSFTLFCRNTLYICNLIFWFQFQFHILCSSLVKEVLIFHKVFLFVCLFVLFCFFKKGCRSWKHQLWSICLQAYQLEQTLLDIYCDVKHLMLSGKNKWLFLYLVLPATLFIIKAIDFEHFLQQILLLWSI